MQHQSDSKGDSLSMQFLYYEIIDFLITAPFLVIFICRLCSLRHVSNTNRIKNSLPTLKIILSLTYIAISITLLALNIIQRTYDSAWFNYIFGGGGGPCINSIVLISQLLVLRFQIIKKQPYTSYHLIFFILLAISSVVRLFLCLFHMTKVDTLDIIFSSLLALVSVVILIYWAMKRQHWSNQEMNIENIDQKEIAMEYHLSENNKFIRAIKDDFPYLIPLVNGENGQIHIVLEIFKKSEKTSFSHSNPMGKKSFSSRQLLLHSLQEKKSVYEALSNQLYTLEEVSNLYLLCSRFPLQHQIDIEKLELLPLARELQFFLEKILIDKNRYQSDVLAALKLPEHQVKKYQDLWKRRQSHISNQSKDRDYDPKIGKVLPEDLNAIYCSARVYKHMWISNHYEFYIRATFASAGVTSYPIKRYSEFQELHNALKNIIKSLGRSLQLPSLPKKHLFHWNENKNIQSRAIALQTYLRFLLNDYTIMQVTQLRCQLLSFLCVEDQLAIFPQGELQFYCQLQVTKDKAKDMINKKQFLTFYQFRLVRSDEQVKIVCKLYSDFQELHRELKRWMANIGVTFTFLALPDNNFYTSRSVMLEKLRSYLQGIVSIKGIGMVYSVNSFFNILQNQYKTISDLSSSSSQTASRQKNLTELLKLRLTKRQRNHSNSSGKFSKIIDDLCKASED